MDDGGCNRGHFCPIKGISRKRLLRAEKLFSPFRTGKHWPGPSDYGKACRERTRGEWEARDKLPAPFRGRRRRVRRCTSGSCLILSRQSGLQILTAPHAGPKRAPPAATRRRHKNGRPAQSYRGIQKPHGRPPAGSIKGAALRIFTSITQRQQGQRAPFAALCTKWKTGGIIGNAMRRAFGCLWRLTPPYAGGGCSTTRSCIAPFYVPTTRLYLFFPDCQAG